MRQGVFSGLLSAGFSFGRNFAEFQKVRAEGVLAKFAIARLYGVSLHKFAIAQLYGHFGSRGLLQNVVLCWHFKCPLIRT